MVASTDSLTNLRLSIGGRIDLKSFDWPASDVLRTSIEQAKAAPPVFRMFSA